MISCFLKWVFEKVVQTSNIFKFIFAFFGFNIMNLGINRTLLPSINKELPDKIRKEVI